MSARWGKPRNDPRRALAIQTACLIVALAIIVILLPGVPK